MRVFSIVFLILFVVAILIFCFQNQGSVTVTFLGGNLSLPMPVLVLGVYVLGMFSGWSVLSSLRQSWQRAMQKPA